MLGVDVMNRFTEKDAKVFLEKTLEKDAEGFSQLLSVKFVQTVAGIKETCGGCTLGDGQDCVPPAHFVDEFVAVCRKRAEFPFKSEDVIRYSYVSMGWSEGGCSNAFGDYNEVNHFRYHEETPYNRDSFPTLEALRVSSEKKKKK